MKNGGSLPKSQVEALEKLKQANEVHLEKSTDWGDTLRVAETAALPAETLIECPEACEEDEDMRMPHVSDEDRGYTGFEACLTNPNIDSSQVKRIVLLSGNVHNWLMMSDVETVSNFVNVMEGLKPIRRSGVEQTKVHRRATVGTAVTFEVLAAAFKESQQKEKKVVLFSPFVTGDIQGITQVGVLVWEICNDDEASMYKTLIANTEFMRHKVALDDRFPSTQASVLELGRDMHVSNSSSFSVLTVFKTHIHFSS